MAILLDSTARRLSAYPRLTAIACGLVAACAMPPLGLWFLGIPALAIFAWLIVDAPDWRAALGRGWLFGFAHLALANNWIATAFTYQAEMPAVLGWVAVPLLAVYLAIYPALAALVGWRIGRGRSPWVGVLALAGAWIVTEWLRGWLFTGYPWPPMGLMLLGGFERPGLAMALPWTGTYALSGLALLAGGALMALAASRRFVGLAALAAVLTAGMLWPAGEGREGTLALTLVQPDLGQDEINEPDLFEEQFARLASLSENRRDVSPRLVLWPESAVPDYLRDGYPQRYYDRMTAGGDPAYARRRIGKAIGTGSLLLTGAVDLEIADGRATGAHNAVSALTPDGRIVAASSKAHLVPYGEYLPMRALLEPVGLTRLVAGTIDFIPGPGPRTLELGPWGQAGIQICYEIVFSGQVVDRANRPDYIFNPSNDGWFGAWGPPQHLAQARMRAIEEGLPVLRSTTTGISAVIDARGVVRAHIGMNVADRIDGHVPPPPHAPTPFAQMGNALALIWAGLLLLLAAVARRFAPR